MACDPRSDDVNRGNRTFVAYVGAFHLVWIAWPCLLYPRLTAALGAATLTYAVVQLSLRILVWVVPVFAYLRFVDGVDPLEYLKLRRHVGRGLAVGLVVTALNLAGMFARFGPPHLSAERVTWNSLIGTSFLVGFIEEIPYRGFMLQKFTERIGFWRANLVTSLLFVAIHVPGWLALRMFRVEYAVSIFAIGVVLALAARWSRSLWAAIVAHSANDFLSFVIFRL
jgi:membrane protease YdiL (CAAX protease family)